MNRPILTKSRGRRRRRSGIALLVAMSTILVLTVVVTELTYTARVRFVLAAHEKERAQAYWVSQTGINIYKLLLTANKEMEKNSAMGSVAGSFGINLGDALWQWVPVINTGLMRMLFAAGGDAGAGNDEDTVVDAEFEEVDGNSEAGDKK